MVQVQQIGEIQQIELVLVEVVFFGGGCGGGLGCVGGVVGVLGGCCDRQCEGGDDGNGFEQFYVLQFDGCVVVCF